MDQVDADDAQRFLLANVLLVEHAHMDQDLRRFAARLSLKTNAGPAVTFLPPGRNRAGKNEEGGLVAPRRVEPLQQQVIFVIEHRLQPAAADVTIGWPVNGVADGHVIGGNGFGNGAGGAAGAKKPAGNLLRCANLGKGAVAPGIVIDPVRLLVGFEPLVHHGL
jgi:hypothetical protein